MCGACVSACMCVARDQLPTLLFYYYAFIYIVFQTQSPHVALVVLVLTLEQADLKLTEIHLS